MSQADEAYQWVRGLDGVRSVRMDIQKDFVVVDEWLDGEIEKRLVAN